MAELDLLSLLIPYGNKTIKVKATGTGYDDSDFSNSVSYVSRPILVREDADTIRITNCRAACTTYNLYDINNNLLATESFSGADGDYIDVSVTGFGWTANTSNKVYCVASDGVNDYTSNTYAHWYGAAVVLGVSGLYSSTTALTRTDAAVGLTWTMTNNEIASDFDNYFPYNMMVKETVDGNAMVYVPEMYWRIGYDDNGYITDVAVSPSAFEAQSGKLRAHSDAFYYGAYGASYSSGVMQSKSGIARQSSQTIAQFRTAANNAGTGYQLIDVYHTRILELLWLIEFADKQSENIMWGYTSYNGQCGATDTLTSPSGQTAAKGRMRWRYIEDFIGNGYEFFDGIYGMSVTSDPQYFGESTTGKTEFTGTSIGGYELAALGFADTNNPLLIVPKLGVSNGSYNTYFCDYVYVLSGAYIYYRGRNDSSASNGLFYWNNASVSASYIGIGSRLLKTL